ncbi:helix-turn-helix domain-containing protein [Bacillus sp. FSL L8-0152]
MQTILINKTYKFCIYPNKRKKIFIMKLIIYSHCVFNWFLTM